MVRQVLSAALLCLAPAALLADDADNYVLKKRTFAKTTPSVLTPPSANSKQFGQVVAIHQGKIATSSNEFVVDYETAGGAIVTRGRVSVYGYNYLRLFSDPSVDRTSSKTNDGYGSSLAIWDNTLVVGAPNDSTNGENAGMAYVYGLEYSTTQALAPEKGEAGDYFGYSVAIVHGQSYYNSGMVVIGAYGHDHDKESTVGQGCVFVYLMDSSSTWNMVGKLEPQDFEHKNRGGFGYSLSAYGNTVAVGTYATDKAFVYELTGYMHECPHGHEAEHQENLPAACVSSSSSSRRNLRALQGPPQDDRTWYTEWKYDHILTVGLEEEHKPEKEKQAQSYSFGHSIALYNQSGVLTLAVGAPDAVDSSGSEHVGMIYVMSIMNRGDVTSNWYPEGYDHHEEDKKNEEAAREQERQEKENNKRALQGEGDKNRFRTWNPQSNMYTGDKMGNFWVLEAVLAGSTANGRFGHSLALDNGFLLSGNNPSTLQQGIAPFYRRVASSTISSDSPIISGALYRTEWKYSGSLSDSLGSTGDHFGYSVALQDDSLAVVGALMSDIQSDGTFGQGAVYTYDRYYKELANVPTPSPASNSRGTPSSSSSSSSGAMSPGTSTAKGYAFLSVAGFVAFFGVLLLAFMVYRQAGGERSPTELLCGLPSNGFKTTDKQIRLATMDDSGMSSSTRSTTGLKSAYSGLDSSSAHGARLPAARPSPTPSPIRGAGAGAGASRTFTPQAKRSFTPKTGDGLSDL